MSAGGLASDEVAEDYKNSLEDLAINSRYEINNLTVIAKENIDHALAISRAIESHIRNTTPDRKLPALFVLDSVAKNVGTPYTIFLGPGLYKTFMETYSLVNGQVRRKLDELLKTWKEPVPGSYDTKPVFAVEVTRPIENDLIRWRTMDVQRQQQEAKSQQGLLRAGRPTATPWRGTPTPPQHTNRYQQPPTQGYPPQPIPNGHAQPHSPYSAYPQYPPPQLAPPVSQQLYQQPSQPQHAHRQAYQPQPQPSTTLDSLFREIDNLIDRYKHSFANNFDDSETRTKLHALLQLQGVLRSQKLQPHEVEAIRAQLAQLAVAPLSAPTPNSYTYHPTSAAAPYPAPSSPPAYLPPPTPTQYSTPPVASAASPPVQQPQSDLSSLLNSNALASILASVKAQQPAPTPPIAEASVPQPQTQYSQPPSTPVTVATAQPNSLIASLRAAGVLPPVGSTPVNGFVDSSTDSLYSSSPAPIPTPTFSFRAPTQPPTTSPQNDVELNSASLKIPRPHLISSLFEAFPNQCSTCGKRFLSTPEGKKKKERHLDWHFRIGIKREDAAKRGQSRSWYVSELDWIKWREALEEDEDVVPNGAKASQAQAAAAAEAAQKDPKNQFILVPNDHALANTPCPICQEPFEKSYDDSISDWVWKDAVKIGSRVYHASEYAELKSDGGHTPIRTTTPDSVLGKRGRDGTETNSNPKSLKVA